MLPLANRYLLVLTTAWTVTACDYSRRGYIATESDARETCDVALRADFADFKVAITDIPSPTMKRQDSPDRWLCEYRIGPDIWTVILDPNSGRAELSRFEGVGKGK
jgi:hypothetical protein